MSYIKNILITVSLLPLFTWTAQTNNSESTTTLFTNARLNTHIAAGKVINGVFNTIEKVADIANQAKKTAIATYNSKEWKQYLKTTKATIHTATTTIKNSNTLKTVSNLLRKEQGTILILTAVATFGIFTTWLMQHADPIADTPNDNKWNADVVWPNRPLLLYTQKNNYRGIIINRDNNNNIEFIEIIDGTQSSS